VRQHATTRRTVRGAAAALALAGLLAGCAARPGTAAMVDGRRIPESDITATFAEIGPALGSATQQSVLHALITEPTLSDIAGDLGSQVTDEQATDLLDEVFAGSEQRPDEFGPGSLAIARFQLALDAINAAEDQEAVGQDITDRLAALDVEVNPRFGTFEGATVAAPTTPEWIVGAVTPQQ